MVTDSCSILATWWKDFSQLLSVHGVNDVRQTQIHTVLELSAYEIQMATEKLKGQKSPGIDQISAEMLRTGGRTICCEIHKLINSVWNKEEFPEEWKELIFVQR